ncbi:MAG: DUF2203 domain-containing protein [Euryarchaeota archaeon]|nr:DUF2203 domain-containing protein [Euryarchaeota archaeon]
MRVFTLDEANQVVARVKPLLESARDKVDELKECNELAKMLLHRHGADELEVPANPDHDRYWRALSRSKELETEIEDMIEQVTFTGAELKDIRQGLIDFYTLVDGEGAYLCWKAGEDEITTWHSLTGGFAGRRPLPNIEDVSTSP